MADPCFHYQFRLIVIGDSTVGKSSLLRHFTEGHFTDALDPTVGVDFYSAIVEVKPGLRIKLQLWDTAGQERFRSITRSYYRNAVGVLVVYDITRRESFESVVTWLGQAKENIGSNGCVFQLVGHKSDLADQREVLHEEGEYFAKHHRMKFLETSAVNGQNISEAFLMISRVIYAKLESGEFLMSDDFDGIRPGFVGTGLVRQHSALSLSASEYYGDSYQSRCYNSC